MNARTFFRNVSIELPKDIMECTEYDGASTSFIEQNDYNHGDINTKQMIHITTSLVKITRKANTSLGGMLLNTYTNCLFISTASLYVASSVFINQYEGIEIFFIVLCCIFMAMLSVIRLLFHTITGQDLASAMKKCVYTITKMRINVSSEDKNPNVMQFLYHILKDHSHSPIAPFSTFSLSNRTLLGVIATILTYLFVMIRFKTCENQNFTFTKESLDQNMSIQTRE